MQRSKLFISLAPFPFEFLIFPRLAHPSNCNFPFRAPFKGTKLYYSTACRVLPLVTLISICSLPSSKLTPSVGEVQNGRDQFLSTTPKLPLCRHASRWFLEFLAWLLEKYCAVWVVRSPLFVGGEFYLWLLLKNF